MGTDTVSVRKFLTEFSVAIQQTTNEETALKTGYLHCLGFHLLWQLLGTLQDRPNMLPCYVFT